MSIRRAMWRAIASRRATNPPNPALYQGGTRDFVLSLPKGEGAHGRRFHYVSPNSDLLGMIIERVAGVTYAELMSEALWKPMGAERDGTSRSTVWALRAPAGGICIALRDMARIGEMMRLGGKAKWPSGRAGGLGRGYPPERGSGRLAGHDRR